MGLRRSLKVTREVTSRGSSWTFVVILALVTAPAAAAVAVSVAVTQALGFGRFVAGSGGTVTLSTAGARTASGGVALLSSGTGSAAQFTVSGEANMAYSLTLPSNGAVNLKNPSNQVMALNNFTSNPSGTGQLSGAGKQPVTVGATLSVGGSQAPGAYTGTFDLIVDYN